MTPIELMVVLAVIAVLISIAWATMHPLPRIRVKEAESMLDGMATQIRADDPEENLDTLSLYPEAPPSKLLRAMSPMKMASGVRPIEPDGPVRCSYGAKTVDNVAYVVAVCDVDGDGIYRVLVEPVNLGPGVPPTTDGGVAGFKASSYPGSLQAVIDDFLAKALAGELMTLSQLNSEDVF